MAALLQPWVEKHRPKVIEDVAHQDEVVSALSKAMKTANMPHLLFYGPPGTGKTTTALAVGRYLYGPKLFPERVLELNASDERGIAVVRNKIKMFASCAVGHGDPEHPSPPYKLIILDEADSMTSEAQDALRRIMEAHSATTRFCFICNYVSRIIEPLASRCAKFRYKALHEDVMETRVKHICAAEGVELGQKTLETLGRVSRGDLRRAITTLQSAYALKGNPVASETLLDVSGEVPAHLTEKLIEACKKPAFTDTESCVNEIIAEGYSITAVFEQLFALVIEATDMTDSQKATAVDALAVADKNLVDGADGVLQLLSVSSVLQQLHNGKQFA